jgi:hypothetical protein
MKIAVEYWSCDRGDINSRCFTKTFMEKETKEEIFKEFYNKNNSLRYCNGSYWKFTDPEIEKEYEEFKKSYNTINNYYGSYVD